jgi:hypothetical protein
MDSGAEAALLTPAEMNAVLAERDRLAEQVKALQRQIDWFKRQLFGEKSERRLIEPSPDQLGLGEGLAPTPEEAADAAVPVREVAAHTRRQARAKPTEETADEADLFFDASVPATSGQSTAKPTR